MECFDYLVKNIDAKGKFYGVNEVNVFECLHSASEKIFEKKMTVPNELLCQMVGISIYSLTNKQF